MNLICRFLSCSLFLVFFAGGSVAQEELKLEPDAPPYPEDLVFPPPKSLPDVPPQHPPERLDTAKYVERAKLNLPRRQVSLPMAISMALANNLSIKARRLQPEIGEQAVHFALGDFDPSLTFTYTYQYSQVPQNAEQFVATGGENAEAQQSLADVLTSILAELEGRPVAPANIPVYSDPRIFTTDNTLLNWELGGRTPLGTTYGFFLETAQLKNDINIEIPPSLFFPEYTTFAGFRLTQPLLKGFGPAANMAPVRVARLDRKIGWYDWEAQVIDSLQSTVLAYYDLYFAWENVRAQESLLASSRLLETGNIERLNAGRMRPLDVIQAQASVASSLTRVFSAYEQVIAANAALKRLVFANPPEVDDVLFVPSGLPDAKPPGENRMTLIGTAFRNRPEYQKAVAEVEREGVRVRFARNQALPEVNLVGTYGVNGLDGDYGGAISRAFDGQGQTFSAGVVVSVPLGFVKERATLSSAKLRQQQALLTLQQAGLNIHIDVDAALSLVESASLQREVALKATKYARESLNAEQKLLETGKSTTLNVVQVQAGLAQAQTRELDAELNYFRALVRLEVSSGTLLDGLGVQVVAEAQRTAPHPGKRTRNLPPAP